MHSRFPIRPIATARLGLPGFGLREFALAIALISAAPAQAQPAASRAAIESASWLAGRWIGEGFGGTVEETWSPPNGGQMIGHFSHVRDGAPVLYELLLLDEHEGRLRIRVKHFNPDFVGWEERDRWHSFEPLAGAPGDLRFDGLRLRLEGDELVATVTLGGAAGRPAQDHTLRLRRAPL